MYHLLRSLYHDWKGSRSGGNNSNFLPAHWIISLDWEVELVLVYIIVVEPIMSLPNPHASKNGLRKYRNNNSLGWKFLMATAQKCNRLIYEMKPSINIIWAITIYYTMLIRWLHHSFYYLIIVRRRELINIDYASQSRIKWCTRSYMSVVAVTVLLIQTLKIYNMLLLSVITMLNQN